MDPQNTSISPMMQPVSNFIGVPSTASPDPVHGHKKHLLHNLMSKVLGNSQGANVHETISGIKSALGAYKNYAKEWDNLNQISPIMSSREAPYINPLKQNIANSLKSQQGGMPSTGGQIGMPFQGQQPQQPTMTQNHYIPTQPQQPARFYNGPQIDRTNLAQQTAEMEALKRDPKNQQSFAGLSNVVLNSQGQMAAVQGHSEGNAKQPGQGLTSSPAPWQSPSPYQLGSKIGGGIVGNYGGIPIGGVSSDNPYADRINNPDVMAAVNFSGTPVAAIEAKYGHQQGWQSLLTPEERQQITWAQEIEKNHPKNQQYHIPEQPVSKFPAEPAPWQFPSPHPPNYPGPVGHERASPSFSEGNLKQPGQGLPSGNMPHNTSPAPWQFPDKSKPDFKPYFGSPPSTDDWTTGNSSGGRNPDGTYWRSYHPIKPDQPTPPALPPPAFQGPSPIMNYRNLRMPSLGSPPPGWQPPTEAQVRSGTRGGANMSNDAVSAAQKFSPMRPMNAGQPEKTFGGNGGINNPSQYGKPMY